MTDKYSYDEWGNVTPDASNITTDNPYQYVGRYGYYTHYQEPGFGLLQLGVRYYDPSIGRFTQLDPAKDGINWYAYADGNPMGYVDDWGEFSWGGFWRKTKGWFRDSWDMWKYLLDDDVVRMRRPGESAQDCYDRCMCQYGWGFINSCMGYGCNSVGFFCVAKKFMFEPTLLQGGIFGDGSFTILKPGIRVGYWRYMLAEIGLGGGIAAVADFYASSQFGIMLSCKMSCMDAPPVRFRVPWTNIAF